MAAPPYMKLIFAEWRAGTAHFRTGEEHGAYFLLVCNYWEREGPLPDDDDKLAAIAMVTDDRWAIIRSTVVERFRAVAGQLIHDRIESEWQTVRGKSEQCSQAGKASAAKRAAARAANGQPSGVQRSLIYLDEEGDSLKNAKKGQIDQTDQSGDRFPTLFEWFWATYSHPPNRGDKRGTQAKFEKLAQPDQKRVLDSLPRYAAALEAQRATMPDAQPCMAKTYLNQERWVSLMEDPAPNVSRGTIAAVRPEDKRLAALFDSMTPERWVSWFQGRVAKNGTGYTIAVAPVIFDEITKRWPIFLLAPWRRIDPPQQSKTEKTHADS